MKTFTKPLEQQFTNNEKYELAQKVAYLEYDINEYGYRVQMSEEFGDEPEIFEKEEIIEYITDQLYEKYSIEQMKNFSV